MSLFGGLPAPVKRSSDSNVDGGQKGKAARTEAPGAAAASPAAAGRASRQPPADHGRRAPAEPSAADLEDLEEEDEEAGEADAADGAGQALAVERQPAGASAPVPPPEADGAPPPPPPPPPAAAPNNSGGGDQVAAALRKIASHIGHPKKFCKAAQLLRELLAQGAVRQAHGPLLFSALKAAMADPGQAAEPLLAREYSKLFMAASKEAEVFTVREKNQLDVYGAWAVLRNQLTTDDSFQFNKVVLRLKEMVAGLPEASDDDEAVLQRLQAAAGSPDPVLEAYDQQQVQAQAQEDAAGAATAGAAAAAAAQQEQQASAAAAAADVEADPFGLDALLEQQDAAAAAEAAAAARRQQQQKQQQQQKSVTWSSSEVVCQRRAALLDCLDAAQACYRHMWARTSVDLLIEHCHSHKDRFPSSQRERLDGLMAFVRDQRRIRKLGPSAKEVNRDSTSFERARAEWSKATVSHRGKLGGGGDHQSEQWLG